MTGLGSFCAGLTIPTCDHGRIVTERIACRYRTRMLSTKIQDEQTELRHRQYRLNFLNTLRAKAQSWLVGLRESTLNDSDFITSDPKYADQLVEKFVSLAEILDCSKALSIRLGNEAANDKSLVQAWNSALKYTDGHGYPSFAHSMELLKLPSVHGGILHPISVALLAYNIGGPLNGSNTAFTHRWTLPGGSAPQIQGFHIEGDCGDIFDGYRLTLVWEISDGQIKNLSGTHHIFLAGDATPRPLQVISKAGETQPFSPLTIIYDSKNAALCYDCPEPEAIRNSVSLDLHLNTIGDDDLQLLSNSHDGVGPQDISLMELITEFPISGYSTHFHRLLFEPKSLHNMLATLSTLDIPMPQTTSDNSQQLLEQRFENFQRDSWTHTPSSIKGMEFDITLSGPYNSPAGFLDSLCVKARRDVHLPIGMDLFPQTALDENRECARKLVRDLPANFIAIRLAYYAPTLLQTSYTSYDLLSTTSLHCLAKSVERRCFELMGAGFIDAASHLPSVAALLTAFGNAINGPKEVQVTSEPWVDDTDLQIYRRRCLYLFWCADWLLCYLGKPEIGPFMVINIEQARQDLHKVWAEVGHAARLLLRNWVAWAMFVECLPLGGFTVRRPAGVKPTNYF
ncbi:hypothetical protein BKA66DRAFT_530502 [Pyrenochaeta sp. MPI-SDFR-AT-0127]|nr:hypothetical protein BKA66DRAFT_530502 [Pyrenochaeta sp. MPI-SDFR-AT-0127]